MNLFTLHDFGPNRLSTGLQDQEYPKCFKLGRNPDVHQLP